jgi:hypothetical protein
MDGWPSLSSKAFSKFKSFQCLVAENFLSQDNIEEEFKIANSWLTIS